MKALRMGWVLVSLLASGWVMADPPNSKGNGQDKHQGTHSDGGYSESRGDGDAVLSFSFGGSERTEVQNYYRQNLPPGLAKQGKAPPGHAKRMARGMGWPPGVAYEPLPLSLEHQLRPLQEGYARFIVGDDVVIVDMNSRMIMDVVNLLF